MNILTFPPDHVTSGSKSLRKQVERRRKAAPKPVDEVVTVAIPVGVPINNAHVDVPNLDAEIEVSDTPVEKEQTADKNAKRLRKRVETKDLSNEEFRQDLQFVMEDKWVAVKSDLMDVIHTLKKKKQSGRVKTPVPAIDELAKMCRRLKVAGRRPRPFLINGQKTEQGADLIMLDIPTGRSIGSKKNVANWNLFPSVENYPQHLLNLAGRILDDNGYILVFHAGSLESS
ncbi:hypothetical protein R1sor_026804 [Riccia sorocarpa]|uniref:Uncharacterized protein n=1 Tax=Riccia sorocarpa TaxID=122646 RepID=A0ABD3GG45_9MARC